MNWLTKRLAQAVLTIYVVISLAFILIRLMPGGPEDYIRAQMIEQSGGQTNSAQIDQLVQTYISYDPNEPIYIQYVDYITAIFQGDFGESMIYTQDVLGILLAALPWTMFVMLVGLLLSFALGIAIGALMAYLEGKSFDVIASMCSVVLTSIPYYIAALLFVMFLAYRFSIFPSGGRVNPDHTVGLNLPFLASAIYHAILPILSIVVTATGGIALSMRGNSIQILGEDYLRVARLRGISQNRIATRYVARNAILPLFTGFMISIGNIFGGSIILEYIFNYPGLGYYIFRAVTARDYPLLMGGFILITVAVVICLLIADLTYGKLDPRAGTGGDQSEAY